MTRLCIASLLASSFAIPTLNAQESALPKAEPSMQPVACVALSPDGKLLATATRTNKVQLWDTATGKVVRELPGYTTTIRLAGWGSNHINLNHDVDSVAFSGDGKRLVTCHVDGYVEFWDTASWKSVRGFLVGRAPPDLSECCPACTCSPCRRESKWTLFISRDARWLVVHEESEKPALWLWDATLENLVFTTRLSGYEAVSLSRDGNTLLVGGRLRNLSKVKSLYQLAIAQGAWKDGLVLTEKDDRPPARCGDPSYTATTLSDDGKSLAVAEFHSKRNDLGQRLLRLEEAGTHKLIREFDVPDVAWSVATSIGCLALTGDGKRLLGAIDKSVHVWDLTDGKELAILQGYSDTVVSMAVSADSKYLATGCSDGSARLWDLEGGREIRVFRT